MPKRERIKLTLSKDEMRALKAYCVKHYHYAPLASALRYIVKEVIENTCTNQEVVTAGHPGTQGAPQVTSPDPGHTPVSGLARAKDQEKNKTKKRKEVRLAPLDVSERVISHLNKQAKTSFMFKAAGHRRLIQDKLDNGATEADLIAVIDKMCRAWLGTQIQHCLRPKTLFGPKFEEYLGQLEAIRTPKPVTASEKRQQRFAERKKKSYKIEGQLEVDPDAEVPF